ncbi:undecaprenyldiphospho-muramoylpentapeptide beta-N-acetylglucosaminyltransferase [Caldibacillus lycopersici]|uniref:UDP-N-acetylglucosamine--N-acetylmuramyl-(pentapeptide) pyrophosphoryl-undecaprenol N-acetylglucosamine transferase n=1 Tax=Perspicuibacillus lycopersici TaxID=1325689 RepID=A0AAE3IPU2_9BACI|nr:undecaprenyldiphospho-muramoylpentapeptide beta-N-acetylglucosaminyltransferase [Perspicuibacillus lycopersici]MCU9612196.1 undecaprenyldiphospho-muramoylpentapeptide beta-N-acetylglucosaminyltransferase [Perspicuibacillus lycopersici]
MKIVVSGGGTGGHIYPALAFVRMVQEQDETSEILYIGTEKGLESNIVPKAGIRFETINITGFKRKLSFDNIKTVIRFITGVNKSRKILEDFQPDIVIGTGGYVCGPVVYAAHSLKIPTIIHEQNSIPGLTNKFLSRYVDKVATAFPDAAAYFPNEKVEFTGNPRATEVLGHDGIKGKQSVGLSLTKQTVLIFGGSRGARPINEAVINMLPSLREKDYQVLYVTGEVHYQSVLEEVEAAGNPDNVFIVPFIHNMPEVLSGVDLVVSRAGATSLAEFTSLGLPSILIPSPYVTNNHQEKNAESLRNTGAAVVILEKDLSGSKLLEELDEILGNKDELVKMQKATKKLGIQDASDRLYRICKELIYLSKRKKLYQKF